MVDFKGKVIYVFLLFLLLVISIGFGYFKMQGFSTNVDNISALEFAKECVLFEPPKAVTASTKTIDVKVTYVDYYTEKNGLSYEIDEVTEDRYVIQSNGTTFIIKAEDYSKINSGWEIVDTIEYLEPITTDPTA